MHDATQQQQQLVLALTLRLADREDELQRQTDTYNFIVGQVLTDAQRLTVGEWLRTQTRNASPPVASTWQETLMQTYGDGERDIIDDSAASDGSDGK